MTEKEIIAQGHEIARELLHELSIKSEGRYGAKIMYVAAQYLFATVALTVTLKQCETRSRKGEELIEMLFTALKEETLERWQEGPYLMTPPSNTVN